MSGGRILLWALTRIFWGGWGLSWSCCCRGWMQRSRRLVLGAVARAAGDGGTTRWRSGGGGVADGGGRGGGAGVRRSGAGGAGAAPGGGRKKLEDNDPGLMPALRELVEESTRGDPGSPLSWTTRSVQVVSGELTAAGHRCSPRTAGGCCGPRGFSTQCNSRVTRGGGTRTGMPSSGISPRGQGVPGGGEPVISVDTKKKEQVGEFAQAGREWQADGDPGRVALHDFPDQSPGTRSRTGSTTWARTRGS